MSGFVCRHRGYLEYTCMRACGFVGGWRGGGNVAPWLDKKPAVKRQAAVVEVVGDDGVAAPRLKVGACSAEQQPLFLGHQGGRTPTGWPHTAHSGEPDGRGPEAKPHSRYTPNTPIPGGAQRRCQNSLGVEPTHLLGVLQRQQPLSLVQPQLRQV
jgi:hypothetical protein